MFDACRVVQWFGLVAPLAWASLVVAVPPGGAPTPDVRADALLGPAGFQSHNVTLLSHLPPSSFDFNPSGGNDCWGYVSPSGREYALMSLSNVLAIVEITDPANPVIAAQVPHPESLWGDVKVYGSFAYHSNETGGQLQAIDLSEIDNGKATMVNRFGPTTTHNIAVNVDSGYLYTCGSHNISSGFVIFDLKVDPVNPPQVSYFRGQYIHDAQVVSYDAGPLAGREIAYCAAAGRGVLILDVTDKLDIRIVSETEYPGLSYCHQCWLSQDRRYLYVNDELDEIQGDVDSTRTLVFDVTDPRSPVLVSTFSSGLPATDHNLYYVDGFIYEANYRSGLRIFDAQDPVAPVETGWFDTYPANDRPGFNGAWSVFADFPSGTVIVSDIENGLFVLDVSAAIEGRPFLEIEPLLSGESTTLRARRVEPDGEVWFFYSLIGRGSTTIPDLNVTLMIDGATLGGTATADATGTATLTRTIPRGMRNRPIWLQAAQTGSSTNLVETFIR